MKKTVSAMMLTLLILSMLTLAFNIQPVKSEPRTIIVPDYYPTIQQAINAANRGDTIIVRDGTYTENMDVNKSLTIKSENGPEVTIVQAKNSDHCVFWISADYVNIIGFTVKGATGGYWQGGTYYRAVGIYVVGAEYCRAFDNIARNNYYGIAVGYSANSNLIIANNASDNSVGIGGYSSSNNSISGNNITANNWAGISLVYSSGNRIYHNNFVDNTRQAYTDGSANVWDNGYPSGGNYWSHYTDIDEKSGPDQDQPGSDDISDTPYIIDENNIDRYPLINPWVPTQPTTWTVDDDLQDCPNADFTKIQEAVNAATAGDTILVYQGTYTENVKVNKDHLTIKSESGAEATIVQAANSLSHVFEVTADYANISGFTIKQVKSPLDLASGIVLIGVKNCKISKNKINFSSHGIALVNSKNNLLEDNTALNVATGISLRESSNNNLVTNNNVSRNNYGIYLYSFSNDNVLINNIASVNNYYGIYLSSSYNNSLRNNTVNLNNLHGIFLVSSSNNTLTNNIVSDNNDGICLTGPWPSNSNLSSDNNILSNNTVSNNTYYGIGLCASSSNNILSNNNIANNNRGVELYNNANYNKMYLNNFIDNSRNAYSYFTLTNIWNSPEKITYNYSDKKYTNYLGNYWSDYVGTDLNNDGVGDTPYSIDSDKDNYPLMEPFESYFLVPPPPNQPPTCSIELLKDGVEIGEIDVGGFFDIYVGDSTDDTGIKQVRFSSDDFQDGNPTGEWTDWYGWDASLGDWNASTKIKHWSFATAGNKEVWAEVRDDIAQTAKCYANIRASLPLVVITFPLEITPEGPYYVGDCLTAKFTIKNVGDVSVNLDVLTVGGRDPDGLVVDFEWERGITLNPNDEHTYTGKLILPGRAGDYHFFCAYRTQYGYWNPSIDLGEGLTDEDRVEDIIVLETRYRYPLGGIMIPEEIFPEGKGLVIPIYVPPVIDNSNIIREDDGWQTIKEIEKAISNFEWEKMIASFTPSRADTPQGAAFSFIAGFITAVNKAVSSSKVKITIQKSSEGNLRAIIQMGDSDINTFMRTYAGKVWFLDFPEPEWYFQRAFSDYVAEAFHLEPANIPQVYYTMWMKIDPSHREDEYIYYISLSRDNRIVVTPKVYPEDKLGIDRVHQIIFPYRIETVIELGGNGFVSFSKSFLSEEESKSIIRMLTPTCLVSESGIIVQAQSPFELRVYDSHGNVTGMVDGVIKEEIPNSIYSDEGKTGIIFNPTDTYHYEVVGTDIGIYGLDITFVEDWGATTFTATEIPIIKGTIHQYAIDWAVLFGGEEGVTVQVDFDGDGIFEQTITSDNQLTQDEFIFPKTAIFSFNAVWESVYYPVVVSSSNSTLTSFVFNQSLSQISFTVLGKTGNTGYCNLTIPKSFLKGEPWTVKINGTYWGFTPSDNATHSFLYFTYTHASTLQVIIRGTWVIPEFSSAIILQLLIILTLLAVVLAQETFQKLKLPKAKR